MSSRRSKCSKCGGLHDPPRGKKCQAHLATPTPTPDDCLARLTEAVSALGDRIARLETPPTPQQTSPQSENLISQTRKRLQDLDLLDAQQTDPDDSDASDASDHPLRKPTKGKKSGKLRTIAHRVKYELDWPHFYVYRHDAPAAYDTLTIAEFTFGYMSMVDNAPNADKEHMRRHFKDLMEDAMTHKWETVRAYHSVVLSHIETGRLEWSEACDEHLRRRHVWSHPQQRPYKNQHTSCPQSVCTAFQSGSCEQMHGHDQKQHICSYCYKTGGHLHSHPEKECRRKQFAAKNGKPEGK
jgi:hypothetical protein